MKRRKKNKSCLYWTDSKKKKRSGIIFSAARLLIIALVIAGLAAAGIFGGIMYGYATNTEPLNLSDLEVRVETSYIYDEMGNEIASLTGIENKNREQVLYKDIPRHLRDAFVAIEDERFYDHFGIDVSGILRAVWRKALNPSMQMQGASTITQQVVKNLTGDDERSYDRKIQEWWRAIQLERKLDKWQILEIYMNVIYMGNSFYGVQAASKNYFGKNVSELSLAECALLAGITNEPLTYNPFAEEGRTNVLKRKDTILAKMLELKQIDSREYEQAKKEQIVFAQKDTEYTLPVHSYFVDQVIEDVIRDLMRKKGFSRDYAITKLYNYGLKIYTTQNSEIQNVLTDIFTDDTYFYDKNDNAIKEGEHPQASSVVVDPWNGHVKGIYGGYGKKNANRIYNRATQLERQPGSSIKPIAVYGPALDLRLITPATVIDDIPVYMYNDPRKKNQRYPLNFDHTYSGLTTVRNGLKRSVNVVAAKIWKEILGPDNSLEYLAKLGIERPDERYVSIAMGGLNKGVSPLQMAAAYVPFANKGIYNEPIFYTRILNSDGTVLLENKSEYRTVYDEAAAWLMTDMLKEVTRPGGTAPGCIIGNGQDIPTAGKTGTTSDNIDKWFVGFTPYYVTAVWYGYDNNKNPIQIAYGEERGKAKQIWTAIMNSIHSGLKSKDFKEPSNIVKRRICIYSGKIATDLCENDPRGSTVRNEYFIEGTQPDYGDICDVHVKAKICTSCKDIWGRYLLAGEDCPPGTVQEVVFIRRKEPYVPRFPDEPFPLDWKFELPEGEYCHKH